MHLAVFVLGTGNHLAGWRFPGATDNFQDLRVSLRIAQIAERGKFDLLFLGDGLSVSPDSHPSFMVRPDPLLLMAAVAASTSHVGLGVTASTTYSEPFQVARAFSTLDHISNGRAAWNAVTTSGSAAGGNFGRKHPDHDARYEIAEEFIEVVKGLWDCWDDDAIVADRTTGQYMDWTKVRLLNHEGAHFSVKGPLNVGRSPQGHPVIIQAGGSESGQELAARTADIVFSVVQDFEEAKSAYASFKRRLERHGREPDDVAILPGMMPIIGKTDSDALDKLNTLQSYVDDTSGIGLISARLGYDFRNYSLDDPVPDIPLPDSSHAFARAMLGKAKREGMKLRDLYNLTAAARGHYVLCGSPQTVADFLERWFVEKAADGFNILPPYFPGAFDEFVDLVVPKLQARGVFRKDYAGAMLRHHLGLRRPELISNAGRQCVRGSVAAGHQRSE
jgi:FMN-dependent oxidoreductase (nitrilotriacetate monooxygenase family)